MLEIIALLTMILDHIGKVFFSDMMLFQVIGRLSFVIYAYFIVLGYNVTSNVRYYFIRILIVAFISQAFHYLLLGIQPNVCFTFATGILMLTIIKNVNYNFPQKIVAIAVLNLLVAFGGFEYGVYGLGVICVFYLLNGKSKIRLLVAQATITIASVFIFSFSLIQLCSLVAYPLIFFIESRQIMTKLHWSKHINYAIYPAQFAIIYCVKLTVNHYTGGN
jgi:hypothetical protein